jgi:hypothetical protein
VLVVYVPVLARVSFQELGPEFFRVPAVSQQGFSPVPEPASFQVPAACRLELFPERKA